MIVIDSSAVVATLMPEADEERYVISMRMAKARVMSAANYLECAIVMTRIAGSREAVDNWLSHFDVEVIPVDLAQARLAADAFARYGHGRHPARLNYGDCFAYALAAARDVPLLYKGSDFAMTDIQSALAPPA